MLIGKHIKELLEELQSLDNDAFEKFASRCSICFQKGKENWLFPMLFEYYYNTVHDERAIKLIVELGKNLHNDCISKPFFEITHIDRSLCIDDSFVDELLEAEIADSGLESNGDVYYSCEKNIQRED